MIEFGSSGENRAISLTEAAALLPDKNGQPMKETVIRNWCTRGARGHWLEAVIIRGRLYTSVTAMRRFAIGLQEELPS